MQPPGAISTTTARPPGSSIHDNSAAAWCLTAIGEQQIGIIIMRGVPEPIDLIAALSPISGLGFRR